MARDRSLVVRLSANASSYMTAMREAGSATRDFSTKAGESARAHRADWERVGQTATIAGLAIAAGVGMAVSRFADFDVAMSAASAATKATARDLQMLREAALQAGADTQYSATEAANAITELGKAGVSTSDILSGGLSGALSLAAAGQMDVAKAAELSAIAMKQFNLSGSDLSHVSDLLAAGAGKAVGSVEDMGMALKQSGLVASQAGMSIEETTGALAAFASAGLIGSDAGTSLKTMLQRLTPQSKEAQAAMDELGISAYDQSGRFVGLANFAGQLQSSMSRLTVEQRNAALTTIFGSDAVRAAAVLYDQGADGVRKWTSEVSDAGFAADQAARLTDNWRGDLERLGGAFDTALIKGGSGANDALRSMTQAAESVITAFGDLPDSTQRASLYLATAAAAVGIFGGAALTAVPKVQAFKASVDAMGLTTGKAGAALKGMSAAFSVVAVASLASGVSDVAAAAQVADPAVEQLANGLRELGAGAAESRDFGAIFARGAGIFRNDVEKTSAALDDFANHARAALSPTFWDTAQSGFSGAGGRFAEEAKQIDGALAQLVEGGSAAEAERAFGRLADAAKAQGVSVEQLKSAFPAYAAALDQAAAATSAASGEVRSTSEAVADYLDKARGATEQTKAYSDALRGVSSPILDAREASRQWADALDAAEKALRSNGRALDESTEKGRENARALDDLVRKAVAEIEAMQASGRTHDEMQGKLAASKAQVERMAVAFGMAAPEARKYADQLLGIPERVTTMIAADTTSAYRNIVALAQKLDTLRDRTIFINTVTTATRMDAADARKADGGYVTGPGTSTSDSIPAWLSSGEYVIKAAAVDRYGVDLLHRINGMRFADGGSVGRVAVASSQAAAHEPQIFVENPFTGEYLLARVRSTTRSELSAAAAAGARSAPVRGGW